MTDWPKRLSALLATSLLIPIVGEFAISLIKGEGYNVGRAVVFVAVIGGCAVALLFSRLRAVPLRLVMAIFLTVAGLAITSFGFLITVAPEFMDDDLASDVAGAVTLCVGLLILCAGVLLLSDHRNTQPMTAAEEPDATGETDPADAQRHVVLKKFPPYRPDATDGIVALCKAKLDAKDLHYVAYYTHKACVFRVDVLDDPLLARFYGMAGPEERRAAYEKHGRNLERLMNRLNADFREMDSGVLIRLVLDVERGALYYYVVHQESNRHIVGVTLDQDRVHVADAKLKDLVDDIRHYLGHPRIPELER